MTNLTNETVDLIINIFFGTCLAILVGILLLITAIKADIWWDENKERWQ